MQNCIQEAKQLDNPLHYKKKLTKDTAPQIVKTSHAIVADLYDKGDIDKTTKDWAVTKMCHVTASILYQNCMSLTNTPGMHVVSGVNGPTEKASVAKQQQKKKVVFPVQHIHSITKRGARRALNTKTTSISNKKHQVLA